MINHNELLNKNNNSTDEKCSVCGQNKDHQGISDLCRFCIRTYTQVTFIDGLDKPSSHFNDIQYSHGLKAFNYNIKENNDIVTSAENILQNLNQDYFQMSCSDSSEKIGDIGFILTGKVLAVSIRDLNTSKNWNGRRFIYYKYKEKLNYIINSIDNYQLDPLYQHREIILIPTQIEALWIKENKLGIYEDVIKNIIKLLPNIPITIH